MLAEQGGRCAICRSADPGGRGTFHVDHDHETDVVRGLLCQACNMGIGLLKDSPELLDTASAYLRRFRAEAA